MRRHAAVVLCSLLAVLFFFHLCGAVALAQSPARIVQPVDDSQRVTLTGNVHPLTKTALDRSAVPSSLPVNRILLLLKRSDEQQSAFESFLAQQQDKSSPQYQKWLTPTALGTQFGVAEADIRAVTDWLTSQGFTIGKIYSAKMIIEFSGTAGQVQQAFGTTLHNFEISGKVYSANTNDPQIPAALAPVISGIVSLNNFPRRHHSHLVGQMQRIGNQGVAKPLFTLPGGPIGEIYAVAPGDFAKIYNSAPLLAQTGGSGPNNGTGQTIGIVGETNINVQDVQAFRAVFGLPANFTSANVILNGEDPGITSTNEETEADLDVQWSGAVAPGATVQYVVSASSAVSAGVDLSALYIIENNLASVMSESYGSCEAGLGSSGNAYYNELWAQAAAQGITAMVSSGDSGSAGCDNFDTEQQATQGLAVSGLASTPYNVSIGGTDFDQINKWSTYWSLSNDPATGTSAMGYIPEIPWNNSCAQISLHGCASPPRGSLNIVAASGGPSDVYPKPAWQMGVKGMPSDNHRDQPDVSLFASSGFTDSAYVVCQQDVTQGSSCQQQGAFNFVLVGGTSAASPSFAGIMALVDQSQQTAHGGTGRQGNANYTLYALSKLSGASCTSASPQAAGCVFNDVIKGNSELLNNTPGVGTNSVPCQGASLNCSSVTAGTTGVLVDSTGAEAWLAQAGYDMTTGLGTVNVANLVAKWATTSSVPTTTALTLVPTSGITHGAENASVTIKVSAQSGTPTGTVSLIAEGGGQTRAVGEFTLDSNGNVNGQTNNLPGGSQYGVYAHYSGDGVNAPSDSAPVEVTVARETSQVFIVVPTFDSKGNQTSGNATSIPYGTQYIIRMYATDSKASNNPNGPPSPLCFPNNALNCPTGIVTLTTNGTPVDGGSFVLNNAGYTRDITPTLAGGTYPLVAQYGGDGSFQGSTSATDMITITPGSMQFTSPVTAISMPIVLNEPVQLFAQVTSQVPTGVAPTGTITFFDGNTPLTSPVTFTGRAGDGARISAYAAGNSSPVFSTAGPHTLSAKYSGDANYAAAASTNTTINVLNPASMTVMASPSSVNYGQSVTLTATVNTTSKNPPLTGTVQFEATVSNVTSIAGTDGSGNQMLTVTASTVPTGNGPFIANYPGDSNYVTASGSSNPISVYVPDFSLPGQVTLNATAGQTGMATMSVTPLSNVSSTVALSYSGSVPLGTNLTFTPNSVNLNGSPVSVTINLTTGSSSGSSTNAVRIKHRSAFFSLSNSGRYFSGGALGVVFVLVLLLLAGDRKRLRWAFLAGSAVLAGAILGCGGGGGGGSSSSRSVSTTTLSTSSAKASMTASVTLTANVASSSTQAVGGTVTFLQNGTQVGSATVVSGQATYAAPAPGLPGAVSYTAQYSGDTNNLPSQTTSTLQQYYTGSVSGTILGQTDTNQHGTSLTINVQ